MKDDENHPAGITRRKALKKIGKYGAKYSDRWWSGEMAPAGTETIEIMDRSVVAQTCQRQWGNVLHIDTDTGPGHHRCEFTDPYYYDATTELLLGLDHRTELMQSNLDYRLPHEIEGVVRLTETDAPVGGQ